MPVGRPSECPRARRVLEGRAAGETYEGIGQALGLTAAYLRGTFMPKHLKQCEECRAYKATLESRRPPATQ